MKYSLAQAASCADVSIGGFQDWAKLKEQMRLAAAELGSLWQQPRLAEQNMPFTWGRESVVCQIRPMGYTLVMWS